jgi:hypothetical protein
MSPVRWDKMMNAIHGKKPEMHDSKPYVCEECAELRAAFEKEAQAHAALRKEHMETLGSLGRAIERAEDAESALEKERARADTLAQWVTRAAEDLAAERQRADRAEEKYENAYLALTECPSLQCPIERERDALRAECARLKADHARISAEWDQAANERQEWIRSLQATLAEREAFWSKWAAELEAKSVEWKAKHETALREREAEIERLRETANRFVAQAEDAHSAQMRAEADRNTWYEEAKNQTAHTDEACAERDEACAALAKAQEELKAERSGHCIRYDDGMSCQIRHHFNDMCRNCQLSEACENANKATAKAHEEAAQLVELAKEDGQADMSFGEFCDWLAACIRNIGLATEGK